MRSIHSCQAPKSLLLVLIALLIGCFKPDERQAGVDDFPNSIQAQVKGFLNESKKSENIALLPITSDSILNPQGFHVGAGKTAARKIGAAAKSMLGLGLALAPSLSSKCSETLIYDTAKTSPFKNTLDSLTICLDSGAIKGMIIRASSTSTYPNGRLERAEITDADGDGYLNPVPGGGSKARMVISTKENGITERTTLIAGPGPDNNFDTEPDNIIYAVSWVKFRDSDTDTLGSATYSDADQDGTILDNSKACLVDLDLYEKGPTKDHADALWSRAKMRLVVRYGEESKEARRVRFEYQSVDGRHTIAELLNLDGNPDFVMREKLKAQFLVVGTSPTDTVVTMETALIMKVGADLDNKQDDSVYAMDVRVKKKLGEEQDAHFKFTSDQPIPSGKDPQNGKLSMSITYSDASTLEVDGTLKEKSLDVTVKTRDDKRLHVIWDALGRGVLLESMP